MVAEGFPGRPRRGPFPLGRTRCGFRCGPPSRWGHQVGGGGAPAVPAVTDTRCPSRVVTPARSALLVHGASQKKPILRTKTCVCPHTRWPGRGVPKVPVLKPRLALLAPPQPRPPHPAQSASGARAAHAWKRGKSCVSCASELVHSLKRHGGRLVCGPESPSPFAVAVCTLAAVC